MSKIRGSTIISVTRAQLTIAFVLGVMSVASAQAPGKWPPDSLINVQVFSRNTPVVQLWGQMRNIAFGLGVQCTFCHVGNAGAELADIDFASDLKRNKQVARQMLRMVNEINARLDTIPGRPSPGVTVTCATCHRGVSRPVPLVAIVTETAIAANADSAIRAYHTIRSNYFGRDTYDFGESTLNSAAFRVGRAGKFEDAFKLLQLNEQLFPNSSAMYVIRGNVELMRHDTTAAATAFREALKRDATNVEARSRLRHINREP